MVWTIRAALVALKGFLDPAYREHGLTDTAYNVLYFLLSSGNRTPSPSELSTLTGMSRANITKVLDQLVKDGLIIRQIEARDARRTRLCATEKGQRLGREATRSTFGPMKQAFSGLSEEELDVLQILLDKLLTTLNQRPHEEGGEGRC